MRMLLAIGAAIGALALGTAAGAQQHYDCAQPANMDKAACKSSSGAPSRAAAKASARRTAKASPQKPAVTPTPAPDTSSPAAGGSGKIVSLPTGSGEPVHYDCTKPENAAKPACKA